MKKILALLLMGFLLPSLAFAAYNDVSLSTATVISVNGITINVGGPSVVLESIEAGATTFTLTVKSGSFFTASTVDRKSMTVSSNPSITVSTNCTAVESSITVTATTDSVVTVTPGSSTCPTATASVGGGPISSGGGGGGGGGGSSVPYSPPSTPAVAPGSTPVSGLTVVQVEAILSLLSSFDTDAATIASVRAVLYGQASPGTGASASFSRNLEVGMTGEDVKALQVYLNSNGYTVAASGPGSAGNETTKFGGATKAALIKFQKAKGITPAAGYFGPKTRALINK